MKVNGVDIVLGEPFVPDNAPDEVVVPLRLPTNTFVAEVLSQLEAPLAESLVLEARKIAQVYLKRLSKEKGFEVKFKDCSFKAMKKWFIFHTNIERRY